MVQNFALHAHLHKYLPRDEPSRQKMYSLKMWHLGSTPHETYRTHGISETHRQKCLGRYILLIFLGENWVANSSFKWSSKYALTSWLWSFAWLQKNSELISAPKRKWRLPLNFMSELAFSCKCKCRLSWQNDHAWSQNTTCYHLQTIVWVAFWQSYVECSNCLNFLHSYA